MIIAKLLIIAKFETQFGCYDYFLPGRQHSARPGGKLFCRSEKTCCARSRPSKTRRVSVASRWQSHSSRELDSSSFVRAGSRRWQTTWRIASVAKDCQFVPGLLPGCRAPCQHVCAVRRASDTLLAYPCSGLQSTPNTHRQNRTSFWNWKPSGGVGADWHPLFRRISFRFQSVKASE